jgi:hypothetical protein
MTQPIVSTHLPPDLVDRILAVSAALSKPALGVHVTRSMVLRLCVERALPGLEREAGVKPGKRGRR